MKTNYRVKIHLVLIIAIQLIVLKDIYSQMDDTLKSQIVTFVHQHYFEGIPYQKANSFGLEVIPYLTDLLNDPNQKEYWVNIIVTLGFIENSVALNSLIDFMTYFQGNVDIYTFQALLSIPFAIGCIASNGDTKAFDFLVNKAQLSSNEIYKWNYDNHDIAQIMSQKAILGLAISGTEGAKVHLMNLKKIIEKDVNYKIYYNYLPFINDGLKYIDRISMYGRANYFDKNN